MNKQQLRLDQLNQRKALSPHDHKTWSQAIQRKLNGISTLMNSQVILGYWSVNQEVDLNSWLMGLSQSKTILLPRLIHDTEFEAVPLNDQVTMTANQWGIPEPSGETYTGKIDVILVPGVAFTKDGVRLGMGKGFYDRFLAKHPNTPKLGIAFEQQILDQIPFESYDVLVDCVVTERDFYHCK